MSSSQHHGGEKDTHVAHRLLMVTWGPVDAFDGHATESGLFVMRPPHAKPHQPYLLGATICRIASEVVEFVGRATR